MKKKLLMLFLGLGLVTLTACTHSKPAVETNLVPDIETEISEQSFLDGPYLVDTDASVLTWHGTRMIAGEHTGLVKIKSGALEVVDGRLVGGNFVMDLSTITSDENLDKLVEHLKSPDFFDVANYPEATLTITQAQVVSSGYLIEADLNIKGISAPITFNAELDQEGEKLSAKADFVINRTVWNIRYGSGSFFEDLGDKAIKDDITFGVNLVANLQ